MPVDVQAIAPGRGQIMNDGLGSHMYYRHPNGEIQPDIAGSPKSGYADKMRFIMQGIMPLEDIGLFTMADNYHPHHPFEVLFMRGGAKHLPLWQIIDNRFALDPPKVPVCDTPCGERGHIGDHRTTQHTRLCWRGAKPVEFPQLEGVLPEELFCDICKDHVSFPTKLALAQHVQVIHEKETGSIRLGNTLVEGITLAMSAANPAGQVAPAAAPALDAQLDAAVERMRDEERVKAEARAKAAFAGAQVGPSGSGLPYVCGACGDGFKSPIGLGSHFKKEHKEAA